MGFFSWKTSDTKRSIPNVHASRETFTVTLIDDKGNQWTETAYDGYGVFGGKDFYDLLMEMNNLPDRATAVFAEGRGGIKSPKLVEDPTVAYDSVPESERDEAQGYFYEDFDIFATNP